MTQQSIRHFLALMLAVGLVACRDRCRDRWARQAETGAGRHETGETGAGRPETGRRQVPHECQETGDRCHTNARDRRGETGATRTEMRTEMEVQSRRTKKQQPSHFEPQQRWVGT